MALGKMGNMRRLGCSHCQVIAAPPPEMCSLCHPGLGKGQKTARLKDEQALIILQCLCCFLISLHVSLARERLKILPQAVTPSQAGILMWRVLRNTPPQITQDLASHQPAAGELWLGASAPGKASARARIPKGSQKGQGLGAGARCPSMSGFGPLSP